jgi:hypothetical protein
LFFATGCGKNDAINQAEKQDKISRIPVPSLATFIVNPTD